MNRPVQYRLLAAIKRRPWRRKLAPLLLLALAGCATAQMDCADLSKGACKLSFARLATDTSATLTGPNGFSLSYSSNPQAEATAQAFAAINRLVGLVGTVAAGRLPVVPTPDEGGADGAAWSGVQRRAVTPISGPLAPLSPPSPSSGAARERGWPASCPAVSRPGRVTAATPWMAEGLAMAGEV